VGEEDGGRRFGVGFSELRTGGCGTVLEKGAACVGRVGETAWIAGGERVGFSTGERTSEEMWSCADGGSVCVGAEAPPINGRRQPQGISPLRRKSAPSVEMKNSARMAEGPTRTASVETCRGREGVG
jgi:hypothetical protein